MSKGRVAICALRLVDPETKRALSPQRWLYAREMSQLLLNLGYAVVWYQLGNGWLSEVLPGVPLVGSLPEESQLYTWPEASNEFWEKAGAADFAIYFDLPLAYPQVHQYSIAIAHGIDWNDPLLESRLNSEREREEWKRRLWMSLSGPRRVVAVDTGVIQWATATWPGLYNQFTHIPNFVAPSVSADSADATAGASEASAGSADAAADSLDARAGSSKASDANERSTGQPPLTAKADTVRIVFGDVLSAKSGIAQTLEAMQTILELYTNVEFIIVGSGTPDVHKYVSRWAQEHERARFEPGSVRPGTLQGDCILLLPAKWSIGPSFLCLQGMAAGAAVVIGQTSGLTDLVIHDHNGWVIQPSTENIRKALIALIENPAERRRLGTHAREVAQAFSLGVWRDRWRRLIEAEFGGRRG